MLAAGACAASIWAAIGASAQAAPGTITTDAGNGTAALAGDDGPATAASLNRPQGVIAAPGGGYYIADNFNHVVRKVEPDGTIVRVAGTGTRGYGGDGGPAVDAQLNFPRGLAVQADGSLLIADTNNSRIRRVDPDGTISTFAGNGAPGFFGDGGEATAAQLCFAGDIAVAGDGSVLISDSCNNRIRRVTFDGTIGTIAGTGAAGYGGDGGSATAAQFNDPQGIASLPDGGYVIADTRNNRIRRVSAGQVTTIAGNGTAGGGGDAGPATAAELRGPQSVEVAGDGTILIPDTGNHRVRRVALDGTIATVAGSGDDGFSGDGGGATGARLNEPYAASDLPGGDLLIADQTNNRIRRVEAPLVPGGTFVVNSTADTDDGACAPSPGNCTLREAINEANDNGNPTQTDSITFAVGAGGLQTITVGVLPPITQAVMIDGSTQPGYVDGGPPRIEISRTTINATGLDVRAPATIKALAINHFAAAIALRPGSSPSKVQGSYLGTTPDGTLAKPNSFEAIEITSPGNMIGGSTAAERNVISGNTAHGILIADSSGQPPATGNVISGNYIGTNAAGTAAVANGQTGIRVTSAQGTIGPGNVISGNGKGVELTTANADGNVVKGNRIGTDAAGAAAIPNVNLGIEVNDGADNVIGGATAADRNVVSGNGAPPSTVRHGILIQGAGAMGNRVRGNFVGVAANGTDLLGNGTDGVAITTSGNTVGPGNVISGNANEGVQLLTASAHDNTVVGNLIGTDAAGQTRVRNGRHGVAIEGGSTNRVGGTAAADRNVISGNGSSALSGSGHGVFVENSGAQPAAGNTVVGNYVGVGANGSTAIGNEGNGVQISDPGNTVGGTAAGSRNVVSANGLSGVRLDADQNHVLGNFVGTDAAGEVAAANGAAGVAVTGGGNEIGDGTAAGRNIVSGNHNEGVWISGAAATGNTVRANRIGTDDDGQQAVGNGTQGVVVLNAPANAVGGASAGQGNLISANGNDGVQVIGESSDGSTVAGNFIGVDAVGNAPLGNGASGVFVSSGADDNVIGGTTATARNVIAGNGTPAAGGAGVGVLVDSTGDVSHGNQVVGNYIGIKANGRQAIGNEGDGVRFGDSGNSLGTGAAGAGNVVSGNGDGGVQLDADTNMVLGNTIGADPTGTFAIGNNAAGVDVRSSHNAIGDGTPGGRNVISGNLAEGVNFSLANSNAVAGNYIGTSADGERAVGNGTRGVVLFVADDNRIGGSGPGQGNVISGNGTFGVSLPNADDERNEVIGNKIGTDDDGEQAIGNSFSGVIVQSTGEGNTVGGSAAGEGNVISGNGQAGVFVLGASSTVRGNYLGTDDDGNQALPNQTGISVTNGHDVVVGGSGAGEGNLASGNAVYGVYVEGTSTRTTVQGNRVGVGSGGEDVGNEAAGLHLQTNASATTQTIGGTAAGEGNEIAFNDGMGVGVALGARTVRLRGNSIHSNDGLGIDLGADGVTPNDDGDADSGDNDRQNHPDLALATTGGGATNVRGTLHSTPNQTYAVDFYSDDSCDPSGQGEGRDYAGSVDVTTDANGDATVEKTLNSSVAVGHVVSATATDSSGNTSEFGSCATVTGQPTVSVADASVDEDGGSASIPVTLSGPSATPVTVDWSTADESAAAASDYQAAHGTLTFAPGETSKDVTVPVIDDSLDESDETLDVDLSNPDLATIGDGRGVVTIADDDGAPALSVADTSTAEGTGGTQDATFAVTLSAPSGKTVTVDAQTGDASATAPEDYTSRDVSVSFAPGETTKEVAVPLTTDEVDEPDESFRLALGAPVNATVARGEATGTIADDDDQPGLSVDDVRVAEGTGDVATAGFTVSLSRASRRPVTVEVATADGSAVAGSDYEEARATLTFAPGETAKPFSVPVAADAADEPDETFAVRLSGAVDAAVADGQGEATIVDNDDAPLPPQRQPESRDTGDPGLTLDRLVRRIRRATLLRRGLSFGITPDEPVALDVTLVARPRMLREARSGDVVIGRKKLPLGSGKRTLKLKVLPKLRRKFTRREAELRLIVLATDAAGNRTRVTKPVTVRP